MIRNVFFAIAVFAAATVSSHAIASTINVDFGSTDGTLSGVYSGTAAASDLGTVWNGVTPGPNVTTFSSYTSGALVDSLGNPTGASVSVFDSWAYDGAADSVIAPSLMHDYIFTQAAGAAASFSISIDGLTSGAAYDLYLYSDTGVQRTTFSVGGDVKTVVNTSARALGRKGRITSSIRGSLPRGDRFWSPFRATITIPSPKPAPFTAC